MMALAACGDGLAAPDAMPVPTSDAAPSGQGSETNEALVINEVSPRGDGPDYIELHNTTEAPIDLCGYFLSDATDRLDHYLPLGGVLPPAECEPVMIDANGYLVVFADDTPIPVAGEGPIDPLHAPFKLGVADGVYLITATGQVADGLSYLYPEGPDGPGAGTMARDPDGRGAFFYRVPTPGAANSEVTP